MPGLIELSLYLGLAGLIAIGLCSLWRTPLARLRGPFSLFMMPFATLLRRVDKPQRSTPDLLARGLIVLILGMGVSISASLLLIRLTPASWWAEMHILIAILFVYRPFKLMRVLAILDYGLTKDNPAGKYRDQLRQKGAQSLAHWLGFSVAANFLMFLVGGIPGVLAQSMAQALFEAGHKNRLILSSKPFDALMNRYFGLVRFLTIPLISLALLPARLVGLSNATSGALAPSPRLHGGGEAAVQIAALLGVVVNGTEAEEGATKPKLIIPRTNTMIYLPTKRLIFIGPKDGTARLQDKHLVQLRVIGLTALVPLGFLSLALTPALSSLLEKLI